MIPLDKGHVRVHFVRTTKRIELADGGFAIPAEDGLRRMEPSIDRKSVV